MKRSGVQSDSSAITPTGPVLKHPVPMGDAVAAVLPVLSSPAGPASLRVEPAEPVPPAETVPPVEPESAVEGVLSVLYGARDVVARASRVPLDGGGCDTLADVIDVASRLRSAVDAVVLSATAALEAARPGSGRSALVGRARVSKRNAKRTVESGEQIAHMPNVARGLAAGELNAVHAAVLADAARRTSPDAIDTAEELLQAAAVVSPEALRDQAKKFAARHDPAAAETALARQRRARCTSLFVDESTGMGVLHAELDPVSFALMRQALENYTDALWRLDGGRDATPGQIRDNRQRLADSLFEMTTDRNALATIDHPTVHRPNHNRHPQSDDRHSDADRNPNTNHGRGPSNADRGHNTDTGHGGHSETGRSPNSDHGGGGHSDAGRGRNTDTGHGGRSDAGRGSGNDAGGDGGSAGSAGRSVDRWRPAQAPNQLVIIAEIGVIDGTKPDGTCEMLGAGPVPPAILDNLSPDTRVAGALFDTNGEILWLGRSRRHASAAQQLAVAIRDRGCVLCRSPMHRCDYHHIDEWAADDGLTDVPNLAALCGDCHDKLHLTNQRLERRPAPRKWDSTHRTHTTGQTSETAATRPP
ncbi:HNH endonuclease [Candidatus Poriferisodalis sp.]|uniref:HNH endonuclease n=1 Tax=Candidatus Poriferisodalis sp. TaxID=3101277 RepID=UPI003D11C57C